MKYTNEEIEIIEKSLYKAVHKTIKKALGTAISNDSKDRARAKTGKEVVADVLDPNFVAESKAKVPPRKSSTMNKSEKGINKLRAFVKNKRK